ncbi:MAG TPA: ATP-binding cassette domain-containing protein [Caulobacterales bacterium]|jgi:cell division transport system ATP-binding protein|nr:ATP-binding cassette domain-containing protein [Caulobacterales bacterium]
MGAVSLAGVNAAYRGGEDVLRGITFEAQPGAVVSILGPAASGKSALLDVLRLALPPSAGAARVLGVDAVKLKSSARAKLKRRIGVMHQNPALVEHLSAFENVALPLRLAGAKPDAFAADVEELLSFVGLPANDMRAAASLSGSERRRVAAARAVVAQPRLVLADEPTAGLSTDLAGRVMRLIVSMRRAGAAVVVATQDDALAASLAGPHWRMNGGRIALVADASTT